MIISDIVDPIRLELLSPVDKVFLALTGHIAEGDSIDGAFYLMTKVFKDSRDTELWGPESRLLHALLSGFWRESSTDLISNTQGAFNLHSEKVSVDAGAVDDAYKEFKKKWRAEVPNLRERAGPVFEQTVTRARDHIIAKAAKADITAEDWEAFISAVNADHLELFLEQFPNRIIKAELTRMVTLAEQNTEMASVERGLLSQRLNQLKQFGDEYLSTLSDVATGRTWTWTGIEWAFQNGFTKYMVLSEWDGAVCEVCRMLHGKEFLVKSARDNMMELSEQNTIKGILNFVRFPRAIDLDNKSPEEWKSMTWFPPFHGRCRCQVSVTG